MSCTTYYYTLSPSWKKLKILSQNLPFYCCSRKGTVLRSSCSRRPVPPSTENGCKFTLNLSLYHLTAVECFLVFNLISTLNMYFISVFQLAYCYIDLVLALPIFQWQFSELILSCPRNGCFWEQYWLTFEFFFKKQTNFGIDLTFWCGFRFDISCSAWEFNKCLNASNGTWRSVKRFPYSHHSIAHVLKLFMTNL